MKKIILIAALAFTAIHTHGQNGRSYAGAGISFGTDIETVGIGVKYGYGLTNRLYIEPNFNYFIKDDVNMYDINLDFQYCFYVLDRLSVYPIAGLSYSHYKLDWSSGNVSRKYTTNKMGGNFGAGAAYDLTRKLFVNIDLKYRAMSELGQGVFHFGVGYRF